MGKAVGGAKGKGEKCVFREAELHAPLRLSSANISVWTDITEIQDVNTKSPLEVIKSKRRDLRNGCEWRSWRPRPGVDNT